MRAKFQLLSLVLLVVTSGSQFAAAQEGSLLGAEQGAIGNEAPRLDELFQSNFQNTPASDGELKNLTQTFPPVLRGQSECDPAQAMTGPACTEHPWWIVAPYVWVPGIKGQVTTFGVTRNVSIDTSDVINHLDDANGALQLHLESGVDRVGLIVDTNIIRLSQTQSFAAAAVDFDLQQTLLEVLGMYRFIELPATGKPGQAYSADLLAGGRYYNMTNGVTITPFDPTLPAALLGQSASWVDLVFGVRGRAPILNGLDAFARADFGGFGIGTSSDLTWNLIAGLDWRPYEHVSFLAGYRVLSIDESQGEGPSRFAFDAKMQGPFIAFAFQY